MVRYIDAHKERFGVEPICAVLPIAPSTYYELKAREREPGRYPTRHRRDEELRAHIRRVWTQNFCAYGVRKTWKQLNREHIRVARCTVQRLMRQMGLCGLTRGKAFKVTTADGKTMSFDAFECAIHALAPQCAHCQCRIVGHGVEAGGAIYCCANCVRHAGEEGLTDRAS